MLLTTAEWQLLGLGDDGRSDRYGSTAAINESWENSALWKHPQ